MCEIPNNVILIDVFQKIRQILIGSTDLTQLTLDVDRDSEIVTFYFDERDEGVKELMRMAIEGAKLNRCLIYICGQAPSDYLEIAELFVQLGVNSINVNPDTVLKTTKQLSSAEQRLGLLNS